VSQLACSQIDAVRNDPIQAKIRNQDVAAHRIRNDHMWMGSVLSG
jgi:hypothetical protein